MPVPGEQTVTAGGEPALATTARLTPAQDDRAVALHRHSVVVDSLGQANPGVTAPGTDQLIENLLAAGKPLEVISHELTKRARDALRRDDLPGFREGWQRSGVTASSVTMGGHGSPDRAFENAVRDIADMVALTDGLPWMTKILTAAGARRAKAQGQAGLILNFQNTSHIGGDLSLLDTFCNLGVRVIQLTYNSRNLAGDGCTERNPAGLSRFGVQLVGKLNDLGILVDTSHCSEPTLLDAIDVSRVPIAITHAFSSAVYPHDRGKSDQAIRAVAASGGYIGVCAVPFFVTGDPRPTLDHWARHVEYICELVGAEHVGIGSDWGHVIPARLRDTIREEMKRFWRPEHAVDPTAVIEGYETFDQWPNFTRTLVARGYSDDEIGGLLGGNFLRVFEQAVGG
jgi:membrane dipeptidase